MTLSLHTDLNTEQSRAASLIHGPVLIIAGAGSGKTRMICYRIAHMLEMGIGAQEILALTFTNKAAAEMAMRVRDLTQQPLTELTTSTFHAFGLRILREQGELVGYSKNFRANCKIGFSWTQLCINIQNHHSHIPQHPLFLALTEIRLIFANNSLMYIEKRTLFIYSLVTTKN
jgi:superfamily I DNA/RNA helicase